MVDRKVWVWGADRSHMFSLDPLERKKATTLEEVLHHLHSAKEIQGKCHHTLGAKFKRKLYSQWDWPPGPWLFFRSISETEEAQMAPVEPGACLHLSPPILLCLLKLFPMCWLLPAPMIISFIWIPTCFTFFFFFCNFQILCQTPSTGILLDNLNLKLLHY